MNHGVLAAERLEPVSMLQSLASLRGVHKRYGATLALDGLDLEVRRGELLAAVAVACITLARQRLARVG